MVHRPTRGREPARRGCLRAPWCSTSSPTSSSSAGSSRNTLEAYRSDLLQYGAFLRRDATAVDALAVGLSPTSTASRARAATGGAPPCRRRPPAQGRVPALASTATCAARSCIDRRPDRRPARRRAEPRRLPQVLTPRRGRASCSASPAGTDPPALRDRALLEMMYACGLRASEAIALELADVDLGPASCAPAARARKERLVPIGAAAARALAAYLAPRPPGARRRPARAAAVRQPPRRRPDPPGALQDRPAPRRGGRPRRQDEPAHAAPHVRHAPARRRLRPALAAGDARPRRHRDHAALHATCRPSG